MFFEWDDEIIHILTDEYLQNELPSGTEKYLRYFEDREIEFH